MSERRFWFVIDKGKLEYVQDNVTNEKITVTELEDLLNELYDENEQLRLLLKERQYEKDISKCREENIKLQQVLSENEKMLQNDLDMLTELRRENKQLRQDLKSLETTSNATSDYNAHLEGKIRTLENENEQLKEELQRFKKYVFSEDNISCYKCQHCIKKDIYVVDCEMKGKVDVHGLCSLFREVKV